MQPNFVIPLSELVSGRTELQRLADGKFFDGFENTEILDAAVDVDAVVCREKASVKVSVHARGQVTVSCDRCLADLVIPVDVTDADQIPLAADATQVDLSQTVYDIVCTALPMVRVHAEGECDPDTVRFLAHGAPSPSDAPQDNPFSSLKDILKGK